MAGSLASRHYRRLVAAFGEDNIQGGNARWDVPDRNQEKDFCLLGCPPSRFVVICEADDCLKLEVDLSELISKGQEMLASDTEPVFLSAGEDQFPTPAGRRKRKARREESSSSGDSSRSSSSQDQALKETLGRMKKSWLGEDTSRGNRGRRRSLSSDKRRKSRRHPLLKSQSRGDTKKSDEEVAALKAVREEGDPLKAWLTLQIMKEMKKPGHQRSVSNREGSSHSSNSSGSKSPGKHRRTGASKAVEGFEESKRRMRRNPIKYVKKFVKGIERELGAEDRPFKINELGRKIPWGKQRTLQRCHYMLSEILELLLKEKWERASLQVVLCLKSIHQTALDGGDWSVSWLLTQLPDPINRMKFGGSPEELGHVTAYLKAMSELERHSEKLRNANNWGGSTGSGDQTEAGDKKSKKKGKGKGGKWAEEKTEKADV